MTVAHILIGLGIAAVLAGLAGLGWCIALARRVQTGAMTEEEVKAAFSRLSLINMASIGVAALGLALTVVGLVLR